nr:immunoglobulin heavy chain junction region [Macaca mulatta]MOX62726.1 immunoglobulin heavy chain junction region [Macaca mulatta]MOX66535.1 immunoglobulin heavy chain junction region [Macaca mulatta]MOX67549.1 immunoglobulin heavy chain junction region [Macaca mulatta]
CMGGKRQLDLDYW